MIQFGWSGWSSGAQNEPRAKSIANRISEIRLRASQRERPTNTVPGRRGADENNAALRRNGFDRRVGRSFVRQPVAGVSRGTSQTDGADPRLGQVSAHRSRSSDDARTPTERLKLLRWTTRR